jgi:hypothetical protein
MDDVVAMGGEPRRGDGSERIETVDARSLKPVRMWMPHPNESHGAASPIDRRLVVDRDLRTPAARS